MIDPMHIALTERIAGMFHPVRCNRCHHGVYDLGNVEVLQRYTDCTVWRAPCCKAQVDDRGHTGWTLRKDYEDIDKTMPYRQRMDRFGNLTQDWD